MLPPSSLKPCEPPLSRLLCVNGCNVLCVPCVVQAFTGFNLWTCELHADFSCRMRGPCIITISLNIPAAVISMLIYHHIHLLAYARACSHTDAYVCMRHARTCMGWRRPRQWHVCTVRPTDSLDPGMRAPCPPAGVCLANPIFATRAGAADGPLADWFGQCLMAGGFVFLSASHPD